ncbi:hypothetical protein J8273_6115 [Carpediemonas membranifera]|uniref:Uncharacterized protein n=1 Tax=Carpediemonas membranifera TaxID=201153 RepID=A0A8J6ATW6_9EUKA|nr:hypothetical protein J8273_6115 [Carpediemonas membranifera]|eukprot:KAG9391365.1 hypothetical protein J8273_6115 [Carpediemonas membranifera]
MTDGPLRAFPCTLHLLVSAVATCMAVQAGFRKTTGIPTVTTTKWTRFVNWIDGAKPNNHPQQPPRVPATFTDPWTWDAAVSQAPGQRAPVGPTIAQNSRPGPLISSSGLHLTQLLDLSVIHILYGISPALSSPDLTAKYMAWGGAPDTPVCKATRKAEPVNDSLLLACKRERKDQEKPTENEHSSSESSDVELCSPIQFSPSHQLTDIQGRITIAINHLKEHDENDSPMAPACGPPSPFGPFLEIPTHADGN